MLQAALVRALVRTALADLAIGREAPMVPDRLCAATLWSAARYGLAGPGVHPIEERRVGAWILLGELMRRVRPALEENGDLAVVRSPAGRVGCGGTGAVRQRAAAVRGLPAVVDTLVRRTRGH